MSVSCHCLIRHPDKPKFLVIRHKDNWAPPTLQVPSEGALMYKAAMINDGMMRKYAFRTSVLRIVLESQNYAVLEMELLASSRRNIQAVWVGLEEYARFRTLKDGEVDPIKAWLEEQQAGHVSPLRPPWQLPGWHKQVEQWITDRLGDAGVQVSGSVQQFKAGWPTACILRVATVNGQVFFKAAYNKPPGEARLTWLLSQRWPDIAATPLAVDVHRNWTLMPDFRLRHENRPEPGMYPEVARAMGEFQVEAMSSMNEWRAMNCPLMDMAYLLNMDKRADRLLGGARPSLAEGPTPLVQAELIALDEAIAKAREALANAMTVDIPDSIAHLDFRPDNFFVEDGKGKIIDWADVAISHPFFTMCRTLDFIDSHGTGELLRDGPADIDDALKQEMVDAYLSAFSEFGEESALRATFSNLRPVFHLFWFLYTLAQIQIIEPRAQAGINLRRIATDRARKLIAEFES